MSRPSRDEIRNAVKHGAGTTEEIAGAIGHPHDHWLQVEIKAMIAEGELSTTTIQPANVDRAAIVAALRAGAKSWKDIAESVGCPEGEGLIMVVAGMINDGTLKQVETSPGVYHITPAEPASGNGGRGHG